MTTSLRKMGLPIMQRLRFKQKTTTNAISFKNNNHFIPGLRMKTLRNQGLFFIENYRM